MDPVGEELGLAAERFVEIDDRAAGLRRDPVDLRQDLRVDDRIPDPRAPRVGWHRIADPDARPGFQLSEAADHLHVVTDECSGTLPVLRFRVVRSQHDDHDVRLELLGEVEDRLLPVGHVSLLEKRGAGHPEIAYIPSLAE